MSWGKQNLGKESPQVSRSNSLVAPGPSKSSGLLQYDGSAKISSLDWMKTTWRKSNSSRTRPKHVRLRTIRKTGQEASFLKCLLMKVIDVPLQSSAFLSGRPPEIRTNRSTLSVLCVKVLQLKTLYNDGWFQNLIFVD